jgi:aspartate kinase
MKLVMKFGGSSLTNPSRIKNAARIVHRFSESNSIVVVVSAMSDVTNKLVEIGDSAKKGNGSGSKKLVSAVKTLHAKTARQVSARSDKQTINKIDAINRDLEKTVAGVSHLKEMTPRTSDYLLSFGERLSAPIFSGALQSLGLKAREFTGSEAGIVTDENFGEAMPLLEVSYHQIRDALEPALSRKQIPVVSGFIASTVDGSVTTLGRGGSDYTASLVGAAIGADEIWIWTDVDGLMTADPRIVKDALVLQNVSFQEALELSYFGAKMMHPRALQPAAQKKIPVRIKNSRRPTKDGTLVSSGETRRGDGVVKAVSIIRDVGIVTVSGAAMMGAPGVAADVFHTMGSKRINVMMISQGSSEATISCVVPLKDVEGAVRSLQLALLGQKRVEKVTAERDACVIAVVGSGMKGTPGVAARIFAAVARRGVNVRMIAQGSSEYNVSFVVSAHQGPEAVRALHEEFQLGRKQSSTVG